MEEVLNKLMFSLLRSAVFGKALSDGEKALLSDEAQHNVLLLAEKHDVAHLAVLGLKSNGILNSDSASLENKIFTAAYRREMQNYELERLSEVLEKAEIPFLPLKGSVICEYYKEPWMRTSCDIDVLVKKRDVEKATSCLCADGFEKAQDSTVHDHSLFSPSKVHVELHFTLLQEGLPKATTVLENVWEDSFPCGEGSFRFEMSNEMLLVYHLAHMAKHLISGGCGIRPFIDLKILTEKLEYDFEKLNALLKKSELDKFFEVASELSEVWFGGLEPTERAKRLTDYILVGGVYGTYENSNRISTAKGKGKFKSLLEVIFLPKSGLEVMYPTLKRYPWLLPFFEVKRWFRVFDRSKRKKLKVINDAWNDLSENDIISARKLLDDVGLGGELR